MRDHSEALTRPYPQCHAAPGQKCKNYKGQACAPHHQRLRPEAIPDRREVVPGWTWEEIQAREA